MKRNDNEFSLFLDNAIFAKYTRNNTFARKIECDQANVSRWRRGLLFPPIVKLPIIAKVLKISLKELTRLWKTQKYPGSATAHEKVSGSCKVKARLLLHFYDGEKFLGQTFPEVEVASCDDLQQVVIETYPGTKRNLDGIPTKFSGVPILLQLPSLREGYGPNTTVRVMQVIPMSNQN